MIGGDLMRNNLRLDRRSLLRGLTLAAVGVAVPAEAQEFFGGASRAPLPIDHLAVARTQLARHGHSIPQQDRVGIVDFGLPSSHPRFALVDMVAGKVDHFFVTHGRGSDPQHDGWLKRFSNEPGSLATSRGAYRTSDFYWGANGSSMRLAGLEADNSNADMRAIVVHGAWYADPALIATQGKLGRSEGCFVFSEDLLPQILYKLGPGRMLFADRLTIQAPASLPLPSAPFGQNVIMTSSGDPMAALSKKAD